MNSNLTAATRICGHQDCNERTSRPDHPFCYEHYQASRKRVIDECPNCSGVYKPAKYPVCRSCAQKGLSSQRTQPGNHRQPQNDDRGWNRQPHPKARETAPSAVEAIKRVRKNMGDYSKECANHESNTIQYLVEPMLRGLGWDIYDPNQVVKEFKPARKRSWGQAIAVDIALFEKGVPKIFVEAKRLDRDYDPDYKAQLDKYASYLDEEGIAVLTNGRFWQVHTVVNGDTQHLFTIDIDKGDPEAVAGKLNNAIGRNDRGNPNPKSALPEIIAENLRKYREREAKRRNHPAYTILKDETIKLIATQQPTDRRQLGNIKGVGPSTIEQHGAAIIEIVHGTS